MARPDQPVLAAARGRTRILVALLAASIAATALWIASSPTALPAQLAPVTSAAERVLAALVAAGLGVYALAAAREAAEAARSRRWRLWAWMVAATVVQVLLAILALSFALPAASA